MTDLHIVKRRSHHVAVQIGRTMDFVDQLAAELETDREVNAYLDAIAFNLNSRKRKQPPDSAA